MHLRLLCKRYSVSGSNMLKKRVTFLNIIEKQKSLDICKKYSKRVGYLLLAGTLCRRAKVHLHLLYKRLSERGAFEFIIIAFERF